MRPWPNAHFVILNPASGGVKNLSSEAETRSFAGVYPEPFEILRFAQDDTGRRAQDGILYIL